MRCQPLSTQELSRLTQELSRLAQELSRLPPVSTVTTGGLAPVLYVFRCFIL